MFRFSPLLIAAAAAAALFSTGRPAVADTCTVESGARSITVPYPHGYVRGDGVNKTFDASVVSFIPSTHRLLAYFISPEDLQKLQNVTRGGAHRRSFTLQVLKSLESRDVGERGFAGIRDQMKAELSKAPAHANAETNRIMEEGTASVKRKFGTNADPGVNMAGNVFEGYFEDSSRSLGFSMGLNTVEADARDSVIIRRSLTARLLSPVNGRLFDFSATFPYDTEADRAATEKAVVAWRDAVVAANPSVVEVARVMENPRPAEPAAKAGDDWPSRLGKVAGYLLIPAVIVIVIMRKRRAKPMGWIEPH